MPWQLWRQDDNGNTFLVGVFEARELAEERLAQLTRCVHKQIYWITAGTSRDAGDGDTG